MKTKYIYCLTILAGFLLAGCVTSEDPFYLASDITLDSNFAGCYVDSNGKYLWHVSTEPGKAGYYDISMTNATTSVQYQAALFKLGTNTFLDLFPTSIGCRSDSDELFFQAVSYQPLHMAMRVIIGTNSVTVGMLTKTGTDLDDIESGIWDTQYYTSFPRMLPNTAVQRTFLSNYGGDTNVFVLAEPFRKTQ